MKTIIFILYSLSFFIHGYGQKQVSSTLVYSDFKGFPPKDELCVAARTYTTISMVYGPTETSKFEIKVWASFSSEESWVRVLNATTISHETVHWRIALIQAALCRKALSKYQNKSNPPMEKIDSIFNHYQQEIDRINAKFDAETSHSLLQKSENQWEKSIALQLKQLQ